MDIFKSCKKLPGSSLGSVLVIGNFDGVHRGHVALLEQARQIADEKGRNVSVLTFEPHPRKLFRPDDPPFRITPAPLKAERLAAENVDSLFEIEFDWQFASQSAEHFIQNILFNGIAPSHIVVGYDFRFGQLRKGSAETMRAAGIPVTGVAEVPGVSSTNIRQALRHGRMDVAHDMLGWQWEISGNVEKGDKRGRKLGFPTANFGLGEIVHPAYGVYAAQVRLDGETEWRPAAVNIGIRPMYEVPEAQVESYIFDFDREIYGEILRVRPVEFLRGEAKFNSAEDLITQMEKDCAQAREILEKANSH